MLQRRLQRCCYYVCSLVFGRYVDSASIAFLAAPCHLPPAGTRPLANGSEAKLANKSTRRADRLKPPLEFGCLLSMPSFAYVSSTDVQMQGQLDHASSIWLHMGLSFPAKAWCWNLARELLRARPRCTKFYQANAAELFRAVDGCRLFSQLVTAELKVHLLARKVWRFMLQRMRKAPTQLKPKLQATTAVPQLTESCSRSQV